MAGRTHLFLALGRLGWGEAALGRHIALDLQRVGDRAAFLVHPVVAPLFAGGEILTATVPPEGEPGFELTLARAVEALRPASLVLSDYVMGFGSLYRRGLPADFLSRFGLPVLAIDTWHAAESGCTLDGTPGSPLEIAPAFAHYPLRLVPVPFVRPGVPGGVNVLPPPSPALARAERARIRGELGLAPEARALLICTSAWQIATHGIPAVDRCVHGVSRWLEILLSRLDPRVQVLHLGPRPFPMTGRLGDRLRRADPLPGGLFRGLVGAVDAVLSLNLSATTNLTALEAGTPVIALEHSGPTSPEAVPGFLGYPPSAELRAWAEAWLPSFRFRMWPLSFFNTLGALLQDNPYAAALQRVELLDERRFAATVEATLFQDRGREALAARATDYLAQVRQTPRPAARVEALLA